MDGWMDGWMDENFMNAKAARAIGDYGTATCGGYGVTPGALQVVEMSLVPTLQAMSNDADEDVKYFASTALTNITEALSKGE